MQGKVLQVAKKQKSIIKLIVSLCTLKMVGNRIRLIAMKPQWVKPEANSSIFSVDALFSG